VDIYATDCHFKFKQNLTGLDLLYQGI
jgi:hypothetical protein